MQNEFKEKVTKICGRYLGPENLPIVFFYTDKPPSKTRPADTKRHRCVMASIVRVLEGETICTNGGNIGCSGGKFYLGFLEKHRPGLEFFLSCGEPVKYDGERFKKSPEIVLKQIAGRLSIKALGKYAVFKRWDKIDSNDNPLAVIFFAAPDLLAALLTLANFEGDDVDQVICPACAGCASITYYPQKELKSDNPRAVLGMFDITARPFVDPDQLTFAVPWPKFVQMMENADQSFLIKERWKDLHQRHLPRI